MKFYSTRHSREKINLKQALFQGLAKDGGLFMPEKIPILPKSFFLKLPSLSLQEVAFQLSKAFFGEDVPEKELQKIVQSALTFSAPLIKLSDNIFVLELFHGPTLAFKDFGAKFMADLMNYFLRKENQKITILAATSGDTGSAVGHAFYKIPRIRVILLYPSQKVSQIQEKQITTIGGNIIALEVLGTFDDCQKMVKQAFQDQELRQKRILSSANSINIGRLIPQSFYYFYAYGQFVKKHLKKSAHPFPVVMSVPSGNFGNLSAGLIAQKMGLPIHKFIAAVNANDVFPVYLNTGNFLPKPSKRTLSNAMDVGNPSNLARIQDLYQNEIKKVRREIVSDSFSNTETKKAILEVFQKYNYLLDPHGAVAYLGLKKYQKTSPRALGIFLATAHPSKFADIVEPIINQEIKIPACLKKCLKKKKKSLKLRARYQELKRLLIP